MNYPVTVDKATELTGRSKSYWRDGFGSRFTSRDENGNVMVLLYLYSSYLELQCQNTQALDKPAKQLSRSASPTMESVTMKSCQSSPTLKDCG